MLKAKEAFRCPGPLSGRQTQNPFRYIFLWPAHDEGRTWRRGRSFGGCANKWVLYK
uniref:Uncharacterized protein n=1 Tax=Gasterosteus aculeatus aculeatus TaxID=481459 RepID=A0AAQ4QL73_GASAC